MRQIPALLARGGSSRGLLILEDAMSDMSQEQRLAAFAFAVGSPDPDARQVNGVGGGNATTSKVAIVAPSADPKHDVDYSFYQVIVSSGESETRGTCGNLVAAVGQFAIEQGIVAATAPSTRVMIRDMNTSQSIGVDVPVADGKVVYAGSHVIAGVPGSGAPIPVRFLEPAGRVSGTLLPSGHLQEDIEIDGRVLTVSLIDSVNPVALIHATSLPARTPWDLVGVEKNTDLCALLERLRRIAAKRFGLAESEELAHVQSPFLPFVGFYRDPLMGELPGSFTPAPEADATVRLMSGGQPHRAVPLSAGLATATLARLRMLEADSGLSSPTTIRLEHPSGLIEVEVDASLEGHRVHSVGVVQTARPIMTGTIYLP